MHRKAISGIHAGSDKYMCTIFHELHTKKMGDRQVESAQPNIEIRTNFVFDSVEHNQRKLFKCECLVSVRRFCIMQIICIKMQIQWKHTHTHTHRQTFSLHWTLFRSFHSSPFHDYNMQPPPSDRWTHTKCVLVVDHVQVFCEGCTLNNTLAPITLLMFRRR